MNQPNYQIEGLTIAITNMSQMLEFYSAVFGIQFKAIHQYNTTLYTSTWGGFKLLFCPAAIAMNTAKQNRQQFDIIVEDIEQTIEKALQNGGTKIGELTEHNDIKSIGIYDPDQNSMVFKQIIQS